jgi:hypothetical protein
VPSVLLLLSVVAGSAQATPPRDPLALARQAYNERRYDEAIKLAGEAQKVPGAADAAAVVLARAHLERYGVMFEAADLADARAAISATDASKLAPRDHVEFYIAVGVSLYYDQNFGAAAEMFDLSLAGSELLDAASRERLFDWWAGSLDRQAQFGPTDRKPFYARILRRAEDELRANERSAVAAYWLAAGARGTDDLERAVGAAEAGWIRAAFIGTPGAKLRDDLDRLMKQVILPERAARLSPGGDPQATLDVFLAEWEDLKKRWRFEPQGAARLTASPTHRPASPQCRPAVAPARSS